LHSECEARHSRRLPAEKFISLIYPLISLGLQNISLIYPLISLDLQNIALYQYIAAHNVLSTHILAIFSLSTPVFLSMTLF